MALIGEAGVDRDIGDRGVAVRQRAAGQLEPELADGGAEGAPEEAPERGRQVHGMDSGLGRKLGNIAAIVSLVYVAAAIYLPPVLGGGFNMAFIIGLVYPLFTLLLLNTIFREDFVD